MTGNKNMKNESNDEINFRIVYSAIISSMSSFSFGLNLTIMGCVEDVSKNCSTSQKGLFNDCIQLSDFQITSLSSIIALGALVSNLCITYFSSSHKNKMIFNNFVYILGNILILSMNSYTVLLIGRIIIGMAIGITCSIVPLYLGNISPTKTRGIFCSLHTLGIVVGILIGYILTYYFDQLETWKIAFHILLGGTSLHTIFLFFIKKDSKKSDIHTTNAGLKKLFSYRPAYRSIATAVLIHLGQQLSCITGVIYNLKNILSSEKDPGISVIYVGISSVVGTIIAIFIIDSQGRKILLELSCTFCTIALFLFMYSKFKVFALFLFMVGFNIGLNPVTWLITGEIFTEEYQEAGTKIAVSVNWLSNFIVALTFPKMKDFFGIKVYWFYAICLILLIFYITFSLKETKDKEPDFQ